MSSETVDWLKKVTAGSNNKSKLKAKVSFDEEEAEEENGSFNKAPKANAIKKQNNYTSKDLSGMKVLHDFESFEAGKSDILVLEDRSVLNSGEEEFDEGDTLISTNLKEDARVKRHREVSRHARGYSGFKAYEEEEEFNSVIILGQSRKPNTKKVLQKYDFAGVSEFTDEPEGFRIGSLTKVVCTNEQGENNLIINNTNNNIANDFDTVQSSGIDLIKSFKSSTKNGNIEKEKKRARKLAKTFFADEPEMISEPKFEVKEFTELELEDDDSDMVRIIAATRRDRLKNMKLELDTLKEESEIEMEPRFSAGKSFDALIMSESIFAPSLNKNESDRIKSDDDDILIDKQEISTDELISISREHGIEEKEFEAFSSEPLVRNGVASTLALLNMRGINLKPRSTSTPNTNTNIKSKQNHLDTHPISDVKLEYFDRFGNKLSSKEAYKELSRKFHGKGPGQGKLDKMRKKREETVRMESLSASGAGQSAIVTNLRRQQEESGTPYMILSNTRNLGESTVGSDQKQLMMSESVVDKKPKIFGLQLKN